MPIKPQASVEENSTSKLTETLDRFKENFKISEQECLKSVNTPEEKEAIRLEYDNITKQAEIEFIEFLELKPTHAEIDSKIDSLLMQGKTRGAANALCIEVKNKFAELFKSFE
jgi:hypothetical protein